MSPSREGRGEQGRLLGIAETFTPSVASVAIQMSGPCDPSVLPNQDRILSELAREEERFSATLETGPPSISLSPPLRVAPPLPSLLHIFLHIYHFNFQLRLMWCKFKLSGCHSLPFCTSFLLFV